MKPEIRLTTYQGVPGSVFWAVTDTSHPENKPVAYGQEATIDDALNCASDALVAAGFEPCRPHRDDYRWKTRTQRFFTP